MTERRLTHTHACWLVSDDEKNHHTGSALLWLDREIDPAVFRTIVSWAVGNTGLSLSGDDEAAPPRSYRASLPDGGEVQMDLERQMWGDLFGQCTDLFSFRWMLNIASG